MECYYCRKSIKATHPRAHGLHQPCFEKWFNLSTPTTFTDIIVKTAGSPRNQPTLDPKNPRINSSFFHGTYKKYSATLGKETYILKVEEQNYPELPGTEYLSNQIASHLKIHVADFRFIKFQEALKTFASRNFITDYAPATLNHIYHYLEKDADLNCENLVKIIETQTRKLVEMERFVELCLFDALIGNHDRHGRNLALIETKANKIFLSPFYDNPSYLGIEDEGLLAAHLEPRGKIATSKTNEPTMADYVDEFKRLGFESAVLRFLKKISMPEMHTLIDNAFISTKRKQGISALIERRFRELSHAA
jgi:plasmid stabilization system protein ParE